MENEILKIVASQGAYAVLFVFLLFYVLKENAKREAKYQNTIEKLTDNLGIVEDIRKDVEYLKNK